MGIFKGVFKGSVYICVRDALEEAFEYVVGMIRGLLGVFNLGDKGGEISGREFKGDNGGEISGIEFKGDINGVEYKGDSGDKGGEISGIGFKGGEISGIEVKGGEIRGIEVKGGEISGIDHKGDSEILIPSLEFFAEFPQEFPLLELLIPI